MAVNLLLPRLLSTILLLVSTDVGDFLESREFVTSCKKFHAILDNVLHGWIGAISWSVVANVPWALDSDLMALVLGASFVDLDHFLAARSWHFNDALKAPHRGIFHCSTLAILAAIAVYKWQPHWSLLLLVAIIPHHLRDGQRRGLYLIPFYPSISTRPLSTNFVRVALPIFPWVLNFFLSRFRQQSQNYQHAKLFEV